MVKFPPLASRCCGDAPRFGVASLVGWNAEPPPTVARLPLEAFRDRGCQRPLGDRISPGASGMLVYGALGATSAVHCGTT